MKISRPRPRKRKKYLSVAQTRMRARACAYSLSLSLSLQRCGETKTRKEKERRPSLFLFSFRCISGRGGFPLFLRSRFAESTIRAVCVARQREQRWWRTKSDGVSTRRARSSRCFLLESLEAKMKERNKKNSFFFFLSEREKKPNARFYTFFFFQDARSRSRRLPGSLETDAWSILWGLKDTLKKNQKWIYYIKKIITVRQVSYFRN